MDFIKNLCFSRNQFHEPEVSRVVNLLRKYPFLMGGVNAQWLIVEEFVVGREVGDGEALRLKRREGSG